MRSMRSIFTHKINGINEAINVIAMDEPGPGNANHNYRIEPITDQEPAGAINPCHIHFQKGPVAGGGVNGVSNESLLAVVIDRLQGFQRGQFSCRENALALTKLEEAMHWLQHRTRERVARGVEGTLVK